MPPSDVRAQRPFKIAVVIPAAGASRRMRGDDKLLAQVDNAPLLFGVAQRARHVADQVYVTLADLNSRRADVLAELDVTLVDVPESALGMSASLRAVSRHLPPDLAGAMVLPADMPDITTDDLVAVRTAFEADPTALLQATAEDGTPGHPVLFPKDLLAGFESLTGDTGARAIVKANTDRLHHVALPARHALTDLDTPEAWADWRLANPDR